MNTMTKDDLPYEGVKVLDLSQGVAGPYCGMHLARNGADVMLPEGHEVVALDRLVQLQQAQSILDRPLAAIDLRLPDRELISLPAHRLDQNAELKFTATCHVKAVGVFGLGDADGDVPLGFLQRTIADHAALDLVAFAPSERAAADKDNTP